MCISLSLQENLNDLLCTYNTAYLHRYLIGHGRNREETSLKEQIRSIRRKNHLCDKGEKPRAACRHY